MISFKKNFSLQKRIKESSRVRDKYPDRIPVICEKNETCNIENIDKNKYLVPSNLSIGQFIYIITDINIYIYIIMLIINKGYFLKGS